MAPLKHWRRNALLGSLASVLALGMAGACGGKAADERGGDGDAAGDGDGDSRGDGDSSGDGDVAGDGDGLVFGRSCSSTSDCELVGATCCGSCGEQTVSDFTALRVGQRPEYFDSMCGDGQPCPACPSLVNPNIYAACRNGACEAVDLRQEPASECDSASECIIIPDACCECGAGIQEFEVVAINASEAQEFRASQCAEFPGADCAECEWERPGHLSPECISGRCEAVLLTF